jgi:hypothetical protein
MHVEWVGEEAVVLDQVTSSLHYLNSSAALVYALILEHGFEAAMQKLAMIFGSMTEERRLEISALLDEMTRVGLLVED